MTHATGRLLTWDRASFANLLQMQDGRLLADAAVMSGPDALTYWTGDEVCVVEERGVPVIVSHALCRLGLS